MFQGLLCIRGIIKYIHVGAEEKWTLEEKVLIGLFQLSTRERLVKVKPSSCRPSGMLNW